MDGLTIHKSSPDGAAISTLVLVGELEIVSIGKFREFVIQALERADRHLELDLSGITRCDEGSLYAVLGMCQATHHAGGSLAITAASTPVRDALHRTGLDRVLTIPHP
ncbi:STAS domain-containing protein [Streptomyces sp. NPDC050658]|uniref:STAS domain-containing protein n=1 Tax=unclassified Streptomyces TaxID=2593676 RepID=UPI003449C7F8